MITLVNRDAYRIEAVGIDFSIDVTLAETHSFSSLVTSNPVETGFNITDMVKPMPYKLQLTGVTSDTPIRYFKGTLGGAITSNPFKSKSQEAFRSLLAICGYSLPVLGNTSFIKIAKPKILTITTGLVVYRDMVATDATITRDKRTGLSLPYTINFVHVTMATSIVSLGNVSSVDATNKQAAPKIVKGRVGPSVKPAPEVSILEKSVRNLEKVFKR